MSLTRKLLKEMNLTEDQIEQIIHAHVDTLDAVKAEKHSALAQAETAMADCALLTEKLEEVSGQLENARRIQAEFDAYKEQSALTHTLEEKQRLVRQALTQAGANEKALELLARLIAPEDVILEEGRWSNADELLAPVLDKYGAFFAHPVPLPTPVIHPPAALQGAMRMEDIARMSPQEINANWAAVRSALSRN